jgi:protein TorT
MGEGMLRGKLQAAAVLAAAALAVTACGQSSNGDSDKAFDASKPVPGSTAGAYDAPLADVRAALKADPWWFPALLVDCDAPDTDKAGCQGKREQGVYNAIPTSLVTKDWSVCVVMPHLKDSYWVAANYGVVEEAKRLGISLDVYEAGGYTQLAKQINQIDDCVAAGADAVIIGAISFDGLDAKVKQLKDDDIIVIDAFNGISTDAVDGRAVVAWQEMGAQVGDYLAKTNKDEKVAWFPGPAGAGWAEDASKGIEATLKGTKSKIVATQYGDTNKNVQLTLIEDTLQSQPGVTTIAANPVAAEAAAGAVDTSKIQVISDALVPSVFELIKSGDIICAASDQPVIQGRIAIDMAVRLLQGIPLDDKTKRAFPTPGRVCGAAAGAEENVDDFIIEGTFAPENWKPTFRVDAS